MNASASGLPGALRHFTQILLVRFRSAKQTWYRTDCLLLKGPVHERATRKGTDAEANKQGSVPNGRFHIDRNSGLRGRRSDRHLPASEMKDAVAHRPSIRRRTSRASLMLGKLFVPS